MEILVAVASLLVMGLIYFAGRQHGIKLERDRRTHDFSMEESRRIHSLSTKLVDEYVGWDRVHYDSGLPALARLGLDQIGSDEGIRSAIEQMRSRTSSDPLSKKHDALADIDLVDFFRYVRENKVDLRQTSVEAVTPHVKRRR